MDTTPIVYFLEAHAKLSKVFKPLFERHAAGELHFAVTTVSIAEVLSGPSNPAMKPSPSAFGPF